MKRAPVALLMLVTLALAVPAFAQDGETPPEIVAVDFEISRYNGSEFYGFFAEFQFLFELFGTFWDIWDAPEAFHPATEIAGELDLVTAYVTVVDEDFTEDDAEIELFYNASTPFVSYGPPEPPPLYGTTFGWLRPGIMRLDDPPGGVIFAVNLGLDQFQGANQQRLRGIIDYDVAYTVWIQVSNDEEPDETTPVSLYVFNLYAVENPNLAPANPPPFADAGPAQTVAIGTEVVLDAGRSFDSSNLGFDPNNPNIFEKDDLAYVWEWVSGPERIEPQPNNDGLPFTAVVTLEATGDYVYRVLVDDGVNALPSTDTVTITVVTDLPENRGPRAVITVEDDSVPVGGIIELSAAASSDPDGDELAYRWRQTNEIGGRLDPDEVIEVFQPLSGLEAQSASWRATAPGTYYFGLLVTDPDGLSDSTTTAVVVVPASSSSQTARPNRPESPIVEPTEDEVSATPAAGCGAGGLLPLALVPLLLAPLRRR